MSTFQRLWNALRHNRVDGEIRQELETHFALLEEAEQARGLNSEDAHYRARRRFGSQATHRDNPRDMNIAVWLDTFCQDVRFAFRQLLQHPGFTISAVLLLALGIGLNAAIFTLIDSVVLRSLPLPNADRLAIILEGNASGGDSPPSWLDQRDIRERNHAFQSIAAFDYNSGFLIRLGDQNQRLRGGYVTPNYFSTLGVNPVIGRLFTESEAEPGRNHVVLLREDFWQSALGGNRDILQKTLAINGVKCQVIGILPSWFGFPSDDAVIWTPLVPDLEAAKDRGWHGFPLVGRLKPGVSLQQGSADIDSVMRGLAREYPAADHDRGGLIYYLRDWKIGNGVRNRLVVLQISALALFLMACANVSSLLIARYSGRRREFAIRAALGASRLRQMRQHVTESLLLAVFGCIAAAGVAWAGVHFLLWLYGDNMPRAAEVSPDWSLVGLTIGIALAGAFVIGLTTALQENEKDLEISIRESNRASGGRQSVLTRKALVVMQIACAVALLGGTGELIQSVWALLHLNVGIDRAHLLTLRVEVPQAKYHRGPDIGAFFEKAAGHVRSLPGVTDAAAINLLPVAEAGFNGDVEVQGIPHSSGFYAEWRWITANYFPTVHVPLLRGRLFLPEETEGRQKAVVINETMARRLWGDKDPLGGHVRPESADAPMDWATVVGITRDVRQTGLEVPPRPEVYWPARMFAVPFTSWSMVVRSPVAGSSLVPALRRELQKVDPDTVVYRVRTMDEVIGDAVSYQRIVAILLLCFSILALGLASLGVYGVISYVVSERAQEFAIRIAVGAGPGRLMRMVAAQGFVLVTIGLAAGTVAVIPLNSLLANFLYGVSRLSAVTFAAVLCTLALAATLAVLMPALRAMRMDPLPVLRRE